VRTLILKETARAVSQTANFVPALVVGQKVYEVPHEPDCKIEFQIEHLCVTMDGTRDVTSPRFYVPVVDVEEAAG
jgi:hypothetical protein